MVGKFPVFIIAVLMLAMIAGPASAATCGDGKCEAGEDCAACPGDCGACNDAICVVDTSCASNICCNGICKDSCIVYSSSSDKGVTGMLLSNPVMLVFFEIALILAVLTVIVILWRRRRA
jgi:hypothetical protein